MDLIDTFRAVPWFFWTTALIVGLMVGSFLNVVIHRLPKMMETEWRQQCIEFLHPDDAEKNPPVPAAAYNLVVPRSACPSCGHKISAIENVPVISYLFLGGKCRACKAAIGARYPLVESLTGILTVVAAWHFGATWSALFAVIFVWSLIALTFIDADTTLLPDDITLPLMWLGLLVNLGGAFVDIRAAVVGAVAGYLILWSVYWAFKLATGKEGMGYGDFKLLAAIGAWLGWQMLPLVILLSALVGTVVGLAGIVLKGRDKGAKLPFGPYLAAAGFIAMIWGQPLNLWYLGRMPG
jgi:leader peptidase (prepilin peptidase)/N-methyltransferase